MPTKFLENFICVKGYSALGGGLTINSIIMLLLVMSVIISTSAGLETMALGQGKLDKIINLDMGSRQSSVSPHFGTNGFASPLIPQPMELDPGAMVTQSERLRDQSQSLRDQSCAVYNETAVLMNRTSAFAEQVEKDHASVEVLKEDASLSANSSLRGAILAGNCLNNTRAVYTDTRAVYTDTRALYNDTRAVYTDTMAMYNLTKISENKVEAAARMSLAGAKVSSSTYSGAPMSMSDTDSLEQQVSILSERLDDLEKRVSELESKTKAK